MSPFGDIDKQVFLASITQSFFVQMKYFIKVNPPKQAKIKGFCEVNYFSKMNF